MMTKYSGQHFQSLILPLLECLLRLYPSHFRDEFSAEIREVFLSRMHEAEGHGGITWLAIVIKEITALIISILREGWHEFRTRKEKMMVPEGHLQKEASEGDRRFPPFQPAGPPGTFWFIGWVLLTTTAIPAALIVMPAFAVMLMWLINLGGKAGDWSSAQQSTVELLSFIISFSLLMASVQWYLLRRVLPKTWLWFIVTVVGLFFGVFMGWLILVRFSVQNWDPLAIMTVVLLPVGLALGLAQWVYLRRFLPNAFWIIFIDVLAAGSILLVARGINNPAVLMVLVLPGVITGLGMYFLLSRSLLELHDREKREKNREIDRRWPRLARVGIGVVALVLFFFVCSWVYASSHLVLAKNEGIYPTVEEAVIASHQGFGGAEVIRVENVWAEPNNGAFPPHVWFGGATVYLDQIPKGHSHDYYSTGSFYIHVKDGWVHMPEGAFPELIGLVMELFNMEGVNDRG